MKNKSIKIKTVFSIQLFLLLLCCSIDKTDRNIRNFFQDYLEIQTKYEKKIITTGYSREKLINITIEKKRELKELLNKFKHLPPIDEVEITRAKILLNISDFKVAIRKVNNLIRKKSKYSNQAKIIEIFLLLAENKNGEALKIFREIEDEIKRGDELFNVYLHFSFLLKNTEDRENFSRKFVKAMDLPEKFAFFKNKVYLNLSAIAQERRDFLAAKEFLKKAILHSTNLQDKIVFENQIKLFDLIGKDWHSISADKWLNYKPKNLNNLKGKAVVINFWAPWCYHSREIIPTLVELYKNYRHKGLEIIGLTKLYGFFQDQSMKTGNLNKEIELSRIVGFLKRNKINYPVAISFEGKDFEKLNIASIPCLIFLNKEGIIDYIKTGSVDPIFIKNKIKHYLEKE